MKPNVQLVQNLFGVKQTQEKQQIIVHYIS